jgi:1,4-alpha-glucan branching enzyme
MHAGSLALILHAHLPFVRHPEHEEFHEEDWLFEAVVETYLPLLTMLRRLVVERLPVRLTLTLTPPLCAMLRDPLLRARTARYLDRGVEFSHREVERTASDPALNELARFYLERLTGLREFYQHEIEGDIVGAFAELQHDGVVEIIACAATHGFLPLMEEFPEALRAQILIGRDEYRECFGRDPVGIWLPECAYGPGIESILKEANLRWFVVDAHGLMYGTPRPPFAIFSPCCSPSGLAVFARDRESSRQVWSARDGYPGDPAYRDFYRDIGQELPEELLAQVYPEVGHRRNTGIKYHRVTGREPKEIYRRDWALGAVEAHATHFLQSRIQQLRHLAELLPVEPLVLSPFDAELFGHWWFEGPEFLESFLRQAATGADPVHLTTPTRYLIDHPTMPVVAPSASSWGNHGYWEVWLNPSNAWIYPHLHDAARRMTSAARDALAAGVPVADRRLRQMARELLLAQSSDWAFLMKTGTARAYAEKRTRDHLLRFSRLEELVGDGASDDALLAACEERDNLFPNLNWQYYA